VGTVVGITLEVMRVGMVQWEDGMVHITASLTRATADVGKLILDLAKEGQVMLVGTGLLSPILQVDGEVVGEDQAKFSFVSMYAEEAILYTIEEIFPRTEVICTLQSRVRVEPLSAHHLCILKVKAIGSGRNLSWPEVTSDQAVVFEEIKEISRFM
jgi:hypothetical protein